MPASSEEYRWPKCVAKSRDVRQGNAETLTAENHLTTGRCLRSSPRPRPQRRMDSKLTEAASQTRSKGTAASLPWSTWEAFLGARCQSNSLLGLSTLVFPLWGMRVAS